MNLKEQLKQKKAELAALKSKIESGDAEAIKACEEIAEAIKSLEVAIEEATKANELLKMIGTDEPVAEVEVEEDGMKGLIAKAKSVDRNVKGWSVNATFDKKAANTTIVAPQIADVDNTAAPVKRGSRVADLLGAATISGNAVTYYVNGAVEGDAGVTAQGAKKSQISTSFTPVTKALKKVTAFAKETSEVLEDAPFLASTVEDIINYKIVSKENSEVVTDIAGTSGIQSVTYTDGQNTGDADTLADAILLAKSKIADATDYEADCVIINPQDMFALRTAKDSNLQYIGGGYFTGAYGNGAYVAPATIWGLPVFESSAVTAGEPIVAAGKLAIKVYRKGDTTIKIFDQNEDDALYNIVTVLGEERLLVAVKEPKGVVKVSKATA
jgi:HK97 family phage major capsid protein